MIFEFSILLLADPHCKVSYVGMLRFSIFTHLQNDNTNNKESKIASRDIFTQKIVAGTSHEITGILVPIKEALTLS